MTKKNTLSKSERLCSERRMETLFEKGRRGNVGPLRFVWAVADGSAAAAGAGAAGAVGAGAETGAEAGVSVLFSVPKKIFKRAWKRNLIKRRMRESYRQRKHELLTAARNNGRQIDIALICSPVGAKENARAKGSAGMAAEIPDFNTIDNAVEKILAKILERS